MTVRSAILVRVHLAQGPVGAAHAMLSAGETRFALLGVAERIHHWLIAPLLMLIPAHEGSALEP